MRKWLALSAALFIAGLSCFAQAQAPNVRAVIFPPMPAASAGCSQATSFLARTSGLNGTHTAAYTTLICSLVTAGVFAKLDGLQVYATADTTTAKLNLIQNAYNSTAPNGDPTFVADTGGYTGVSNKFLDTGFNPTSASSPNYVLNSASLFVWSGTVAQDVAGASLIGLASGGTNGIATRSSLDTFLAQINAGSATSLSNTDGSGFWLAQRTSSSNIDVYRNGASFSLTNASASTSIPNADFTVFVGSNFSTDKAFAVGWGLQLTAGDITNLYNALHVYLQTIAGLP